MKPQLKFVPVALLAAVAFAPAAQAATAAAIAACNKTLRKEVAQMVRKGADLVAKCQNSIDKGKLAPGTNCNADFLAEMDGVTSSTAFGGKAGKLKNTFQKKLVKSCAGEDGTVGTADDVSFSTEVLLAPNLRKGSLGWALDRNENVVVAPNADALPDPTANAFENDLEDDCIVLEDHAAWLAKSDLQRGIEMVTCMAISEAKAVTVKAGLAFATDRSVSKTKMSFTKPNVTYDSGVDQSPVDGVPDSATMPSSAACPLPGIGACAGAPTTNCTLAPGSGINLFCVDDVNTVCAAPGVPYPCCTGPGTASCGCNVAGAADTCPPAALCGGAPCCAEALNGPDGITAGEAPAGSMGYGKLFVSLQDDAATAGKIDSAVVKCWAEDVKDSLSMPVTTVTAGTCDCGTPPQPGCVVGACTTSADCDSVNTPSQYACLSGDEYHCQLDGLTSSNRDGAPACTAGVPGSCLLTLVPGPPGSGCGIPGGGLCAVGTCVGGARAGHSCDILGITGCPGGGTCTAGAPGVLSGDEVGFYAPSFGGMAYLNCPAQFRLDFPMEITAGAGLAAQDLAASPLSLCLPTGTSIQVQGAYIHEPGSGATGLLQFYTGGVGLTESHDKIPCPDTAQALPASSTGLPTSTGVGPIIGATGAGL